MTKAPDRIWAWPFKDWFRGGCSTHKVKAAGAKDVGYLLSTPAREAAEELLEALELVVKRCGPRSEDGAIARAAIAKAKGE